MYHKYKQVQNTEETVKQELDEESQDKDPLSCEQNSDEDRINIIDVVEHKIEVEWIKTKHLLKFKLNIFDIEKLLFF